ncbi:MAG TPA: O-antigen ligase family protein [Terriglobales bacterium]|nr:O-antigen ligase family protein [Terriglobales bacterium]
MAFSALLLPMGAFGALVIAQWLLHLSVYPGATLTEFIQLAGCGCVYYLMYNAGRDSNQISSLAWILWLFTGLVATEAIFQYFSANKQIYWFHNASYAEPVGPYVYHNHYAGCIVLLLPIAIAVACRPQKSRDPDWITWMRRGIAPALGFASVVIAHSRGGILALAFELALTLFVFWRNLRQQRRARILLLYGIAVLLGFGFLTNWGVLAQSFSRLGAHDMSYFDRLQIAKACYHIFLDHRWVGSGFNTFSTIYPAYQTFATGLLVLQAHNEYAQALAETGLFGATCVVAFVILWGRAICRRHRQSGAVRSSFVLQDAAFIGTAGFMIHSVIDFQFHSPANALLFFLLTAVATAQSRSHFPPGPRRRNTDSGGTNARASQPKSELRSVRIFPS